MILLSCFAVQLYVMTLNVSRVQKNKRKSELYFCSAQHQNYLAMLLYGA